VYIIIVIQSVQKGGQRGQGLCSYIRSTFTSLGSRHTISPIFGRNVALVLQGTGRTNKTRYCGLYIICVYFKFKQGVAFFSETHIHCAPLKTVPLCDCLYLCQVLTDFQNSFIYAFCVQSAMK